MFALREVVATYEPEWKLQTRPLPGGDAGVAVTVSEMRRLTHEGKLSSDLRRVVADATAVINPADQASILRRLAGYLRTRFQYVRGPKDVQLLTGPRAHAWRLRYGGRFYGNCADLAMMQGACLLSVGFPVQFVTIATGKYGLAENHTFCEVREGNIWRSMDFLYPAGRDLPRPPRTWEV